MDKSTVYTLTGTVERITYYNPENGYSVIHLRPQVSHITGVDRQGMVTIVGSMPELSPGEHLRLSGRWVNHPKHGLQFQTEVCEQILPATLEGMRRYLGSGLIKGIGPGLAGRIVTHFGKLTVEIIENQPDRLCEVPDIGTKRARLVANAWKEQKHVKEIMLFLHGHAVSTNLAVKIYKQYGDQSLEIVRTDPYRLARDIFGVGFKTADRIAQNLGLPRDHPSRIEAGAIFVLNEMTDQGHVYVPKEQLLEQAALLLEVAPDLMVAALERLAKDDRVRQEVLPFGDTGKTQQAASLPATSLSTGLRESPPNYGQPSIYLTPLYFSEVGVADRLRTLASTIPSRLCDLPPAFISLDPLLSPEQQSAIRMALSHPVSVLTGGPGTGKTTCLRALISALENAHKRYALASPTGRAAKRLSQATGHSASTIHRLLGYSPKGGFKFNVDNPLLIDMLVVDETSMLDLILANHLFKALAPGTHLLLVGDVDQLPSVGAGDVLRDVIASQVAPVTRLNIIFRQAAGSQIIINAHRINQGQMPVFSQVPSSTMGDHQDKISALGDFFFFSADTPEEAAEWMEQVVCKRIPEKFNLHPRDQVQVLAPMYRGPVGVTALNERLQAVLNPPSPNETRELASQLKGLFGQIFRAGDKVMQIRNNYDKEVFNGDIGLVLTLDAVEHILTADFEGHVVNYDWSDVDQLVLAYAVSVHKAQGSEFPAVVVPIVTAHYLMLQRNLLYTAITRAKQLCVLVGSKKAIGIAVHNNKVAQRYTALDWRLRFGSKN